MNLKIYCIWLPLITASFNTTVAQDHDLGDYANMSIEDMRKAFNSLEPTSSPLPQFPSPPSQAASSCLTQEEAENLLALVEKKKEEALEYLHNAKHHQDNTEQLLSSVGTYSYTNQLACAITFFCVIYGPFSALIDGLEYLMLHHGLKIDEAAYPKAYAWIKNECATCGLPPHLYFLGASLMPHEWLTPVRASLPHIIDVPLSEIATLESILNNNPNSADLDRYRAAIYVTCATVLSGRATQEDAYLRSLIAWLTATSSVLLSSLLAFGLDFKNSAGITPKIVSAAAFCFTSYKTIQSVLVLHSLPKQHMLKAIATLPDELVPACIHYFTLVQQHQLFKSHWQEYIHKLQERLAQPQEIKNS